MKYENAPLYMKSFSLTKDLFERTAKFPRYYRASLGSKIQNYSIELTEKISIALLSNTQRNTALRDADQALQSLRLALRLCRELSIFSEKQHRFISKEVVEIGRMIGGWKKSLT